jgi:uncharacterized damage-inducible protein DinB
MRVIDLFSHWAQVRNDLMTTIDHFDDDDLDYVPFPNSWSVGQILLHIASAEEGWFQYVVRQEYDQWPADFKLKDHPSKDKIKVKLLEVHDRTIEFITTLEIEDLNTIIDYPWDGKGRLGWIIWHVIEHEIHHRGELSLILGMLGREGLDI